MESCTPLDNHVSVTIAIVVSVTEKHSTKESIFGKREREFVFAMHSLKEFVKSLELLEDSLLF